MATPVVGQPVTQSLPLTSTPLLSASLPSLLKPSYFQAPGSNAASSRLPTEEAIPSVTPPPTQTAHSQPIPLQTLQQTNTQAAFLRLFNARDKAVGTPKEQQAAAVVHKSLDSLVTETPLRNGLPGSGLVDRHALVRSAVRALANSDSFIDILVSELDKSGLLRQ